MARFKRMADFSISVPDRPGELARLAAKLKQAKVNLRGIWGFATSPGKAQIYCVPEKADKFRAFSRAAGLEAKEGMAIQMTGEDKVGALVDTLDKISAAGINIHALDAVAVSGKFGCFIWVEEKDRENLAKLLKA